MLSKNMGRVTMVTKKKNLKTYEQKRNFSKTPEPRAKKPSRKKKSPLFVIQEHHASHLHWDLRLEIDGILKSWAVPKGPSTNPKEKRLAIETEDHPLAYAHFEGTIPEGLYGAGTVMVWDIGTYQNIRGDEKTIIPMETCYEQGRIEIVFEGTKLKGAYALIHFRPNEKNWLFFKVTDEYASADSIIKTHNKSALTHRSIEEIAQQTKDQPLTEHLS